MARYLTEYRDFRPVSQFVPENLDIQQDYFDRLQKQQDAYKLNIEGLNKQTDALVNDIPGAIEDKKRIESRFGELRNINYNDPIQQQQALKGVQEIQNEFSPFGKLGARDKKKKEYDLVQKDLVSRYKDNPMMLSYMTNELKEKNLTPERAIQFNERGVPINTEVLPPEEFVYKDKNDEFTKWLKDTEFDQISTNTGLTPEQGHQALYSYLSGNTQEKKGEKIYNALKQRAYGDPNLLKSIQAEALYFTGDKANADQLLESALQGVVTGGKFKRQNVERKYREDEAELAAAKQAQIAEQQRFTTETGAAESAGNWAKIAGLDKYFEDSGEIKVPEPHNFNIVTFVDPKTGKQKTISYSSAKERLDAEEIEKNKGWRVLEREPDKKTLDKNVTEGLQELYKKTSALGLNVLRPDGSIDGKATKDNAMNYFKGLSVYSNYTVPFINADIVKNISNDMFGNLPNIHNMEIYEQGNPESKTKYTTDDAKAKFKNSQVVGLDYTADKPGAMKFIAPSTTPGLIYGENKSEYADKPYTAISRNKTLQEQMKPVQELTTKSIEAAKTGKVDKAAEFLTNQLKGNVVKDVFGHDVQLEQLGIPVASTKDLDGTLRVSYLDNSTGSPMIQILEYKRGKGISIKSLDEVQQEKTGEIFNVKGALSQYQKQSAKEVLPSVSFESPQ